MKKLLQLFLLFLALVLLSQTQNLYAAEMYLFTQHADMENSKASEYIDFKSKENVLGLGFATHVLNKNTDKFDVRFGLGKSDTDIKISQTVNVFSKTYRVEKELEYNTSMYIFIVSYLYHVSKTLSIQAEFEQSKNVLKRNTYMFKFSYNF